MIRIHIAGLEQQLGDDLSGLDERWINQHVNGRRAAGQPVCVQVRIETGSLDLGLSTPACASGGYGRPPEEHEKGIVELWRKHGLFTSDFSGGNVIAFLKQLRRYL